MDLFPAVLMISHSLSHGLHNLYKSHNFLLHLARSNLLVPLLLPALPDFETLPSYPVRESFPNLLCSMHSSLSRLGHTGPHGPTIQHDNRSPGPHATTSRVTSSGSRTVLTPRLGTSDHGAPFDHFVSRPLLSDRAQRPGPDSDGPEQLPAKPIMIVDVLQQAFHRGAISTGRAAERRRG
jgi:hypothetical protein